jgi:hypothetical protein
MLIPIKERLRPYTHLPGTICPLPGSLILVHVYPTKLIFEDTESGKMQEMNLPIQGPVKGFTVQLDLEGEKLSVWGHACQGYFNYQISYDPSGHKIHFYVARDPAKFLQNLSLPAFLAPGKLQKARSFGSRLSFGNHKSQDWELVSRRLALEEILPHWHRLGQLFPQVTSAFNTSSLEELCVLFQAGFRGLLAPQKADSLHQGIAFQAPEASPFSLLTGGAHLIEQAVVNWDEKAGELHLLGSLLPEFHCGRLVDCYIEGVGKIDLEWSKKTLRRMVITSTSTRTLSLDPKGYLKRCRLRLGRHDHGRVIQLDEPLTLKQDQVYWFDRFER